MRNKLIYTSLFLLFVSMAWGQEFLNPDLNGPEPLWATILPYDWQSVPASDPCCMADSLGFSDTPDLVDINGPTSWTGNFGNPYSGLTFLTGLHFELQDYAFYHEGIMQTVSGFVPGESYTIGFQQAVVKQENGLDQSGSWAVYLECDLIEVTLPTFSDQPYNSTSLIWESRSVTFTATGTDHTIKFLPQDDDLNFLSSETDITGGLRMGIDSIYLDICSEPLTFDLGNDTLLCAGESITLNVNTPDATYLWQDNTTDSIFTISEEGVYWVQVANTSGCGFAQDTIIVSYSEVSSVNLGNDTSLCQGQTLVLDATLSNASYTWQDNSNSSTYDVSQTGIYTVQVSDNCEEANDTILVEFNPLPLIDLGNDLILCADEMITLDATAMGASYLWQDNSTDPTFNVTQTGVYSVIINVDGCGNSDTLSVVSIPVPDPPLPNDTLICDDDIFYVPIPSDIATFYWENGDVDSPRAISEQGIYIVYIDHHCGTLIDTLVVITEDCSIRVYVPNAFTPDGDGVNDYFAPVIHTFEDKYVSDFDFSIYNRWGHLMYHSTDLKSCRWSGEARREGSYYAQDGSYVWVLRYATTDRGDRKEMFGTVTVLR